MPPVFTRKGWERGEWTRKPQKPVQSPFFTRSTGRGRRDRPLQVTRYDRRVKLLAAGLSALAGFIDATGFITSGGFFVSFMSGNTTRLAVGLAAGTSSAAIAAGLIVIFVAGVMLGTLAGYFIRVHRAAGVLGLVTILLVLAAMLGGLGETYAAVTAMTLAMGAENAVFEREGEVHIGLTYMTGTLVKLGQHLTRALLGGPRWRWTPYLMLWLGLASGAVAGALAYPHLGLNNLWLAAAAASVFTVIAWHIGKPLTSQPGVLE
jgi:uncharacterized membrane protein YoaK (UPF0700 family)